MTSLDAVALGLGARTTPFPTTAPATGSDGSLFDQLFTQALDEMNSEYSLVNELSSQASDISDTSWLTNPAGAGGVAGISGFAGYSDPLSGIIATLSQLGLFTGNADTASGQPTSPGSITSAPVGLYSDSDSTSVAGPTPSKAELKSIATETARKYGVDPRLVQSVINAESEYNPRALSHAGAQGLMQLMPATASALGVSNPMDPQQNIDGGVRYLKQMLSRYNGNVSLALAAYNAGPAAVDRAGGIPDYQETQSYVKKVLHDAYNRIV